MPIEPILAGIAARCQRLRTGLDIGFSDATVSARLRERFGGLWMTVSNAVADNCPSGLAADTVHRFAGEQELPFDGNQFEVAVLNGAVISPSLAREVHRVLRSDGLLFFSVEETVRRGPASTLSRLYNEFLRCGYDIVSVVRPPWWHFGRDGRMLTVCARKKYWREQKSLRVF